MKNCRPSQGLEITSYIPDVSVEWGTDGGNDAIFVVAAIGLFDKEL